MKIIQIHTHDGRTVLGLGDDGNVYRWQRNGGTWSLDVNTRDPNDDMPAITVTINAPPDDETQAVS